MADSPSSSGWLRSIASQFGLDRTPSARATRYSSIGGGEDDFRSPLLVIQEGEWKPLDPDQEYPDLDLLDQGDGDCAVPNGAVGQERKGAAAADASGGKDDEFERIHPTSNNCDSLQRRSVHWEDDGLTDIEDKSREGSSANEDKAERWGPGKGSSSGSTSVHLEEGLLMVPPDALTCSGASRAEPECGPSDKSHASPSRPVIKVEEDPSLAFRTGIEEELLEHNIKGDGDACPSTVRLPELRNDDAAPLPASHRRTGTGKWLRLASRLIQVALTMTMPLVSNRCESVGAVSNRCESEGLLSNNNRVPSVACCCTDIVLPISLRMDLS